MDNSEEYQSMDLDEDDAYAAEERGVSLVSCQCVENRDKENAGDKVKVCILSLVHFRPAYGLTYNLGSLP